MNKTIVNTLVRIGVGVIFLAHGIAKLQMGLDNVGGWFSSIGLPAFMAYAVAYIELLGGIAMILGVGTRVVSVLFAVLMLGAILKVKWSNGLLGNGQAAGYEFDLALLLLSAHLFVAEDGYSLQRLWRKDSKKELRA